MRIEVWDRHAPSNWLSFYDVNTPFWYAFVTVYKDSLAFRWEFMRRFRADTTTWNPVLRARRAFRSMLRECEPYLPEYPTMAGVDEVS